MREQLLQMPYGRHQRLMGRCPASPDEEPDRQPRLDDRILKRQVRGDRFDDAGERRIPTSKASRKKRIAAGAGQKVEEINKLLKMHRHADMMKAWLGKRGPMAGIAQGWVGSGMPSAER